VTTWWTTDAIYAEASVSREERLEQQRAMTVATNEIANWPIGPAISGEAAILMEAQTGTILYSKNVDWKEYPASTTKLLTCLIAAEQCSMDEMVTMSKDAIYSTPYDSSHIAMDVGESITMEQALNAILIRSANEVAFAVGEHIAGSWEAFADVMNERAAQLGCTNSNFVNPNGLPDENHYTTCTDMALIADAFFDIELLCKISSTPILHIPASDTQPQDILEASSNRLLPGKDYAYEYLVGSKTGYTNAARNCLVSCAQKDGMRLICVVMKDESPLQFADTVSLFDYGFNNFEMIKVADYETKYDIDNAGFFYSDTSIFGSSNPILSLNQSDRIVLPKTIRFEDTQSSISYEGLTDDQGALITYTYNGVEIGTASVDWVQEGEPYDFDSLQAIENEEQTQTQVESEETKQKQGTDQEEGTPAVVFINVMKIALGGAVIVALLIAVAVGRVILKNYAINLKSRRGKAYRPSKHRERTPDYEDLRARHKEQIRAAKRRYKRSRRF
jgi:D-alanyl-D-alanine carboxypeptidase